MPKTETTKEGQTVQVPENYYASADKGGKLNPHGFAYIKGAVARLANQPRQSPYAHGRKGSGGFAAAWFAGWDDNAAKAAQQTAA